MSLQKVFDARRQDLLGPWFPAEVDTLNLAWIKYCAASKPSNLGRLLKGIPGFEKILTREPDSSLYTWFAVARFCYPDGRDQIIVDVAFPGLTDWNLRDGAITDRSCAVYGSLPPMEADVYSIVLDSTIKAFRERVLISTLQTPEIIGVLTPRIEGVKVLPDRKIISFSLEADGDLPGYLAGRLTVEVPLDEQIFRFALANNGEQLIPILTPVNERLAGTITVPFAVPTFQATVAKESSR